MSAEPPPDALGRLLGEAACTRLVTRYCRHIDTYEDEAVVSLFTPDGVWERPGWPPLCGHDEIRRFLGGRDRTTLMRHVISNCLIDVIDASRARGVSYWTGYVAPSHTTPAPAAPRGPYSIGEYHDEFMFDGTQWRIARRTMRYVFRADAQASRTA